MRSAIVMSESGSVTTGLLILLPLLLAVFALVTAIGYSLQNDAQLKHICRVELLRSQETAAEKLEQLMKLNRKAAMLRAKRTRAEHLVKAAPVGVSRAAATAYLITVQLEQLAFASQQKLIKLEGERVSRAGPANALRVMRSATGSFSALQSESTGSARLSIRESLVGAFAVVASPAGSITPDYNPAPDFTRRQTTRIEIEVPVAGFLPNWARQFVSFKNLAIHTTCAATLKKKGLKWQPELQD